MMTSPSRAAKYPGLPPNLSVLIVSGNRIGWKRFTGRDLEGDSDSDSDYEYD